MPTTTLNHHQHEYGTRHSSDHISGTHHLEQTIIKEEANIRGRELNIIGATNIIKHDNNSGLALGSTKEGAAREREGVLAEAARFRGRER